MFVERARGSGWLSVRRATFMISCWKSSELFSEQEANKPSCRRADFYRTALQTWPS